MNKTILLCGILSLLCVNISAAEGHQAQALYDKISQEVASCTSRMLCQLMITINDINTNAANQVPNWDELYMHALTKYAADFAEKQDSLRIFYIQDMYSVLMAFVYQIGKVKDLQHLQRLSNRINLWNTIIPNAVEWDNAITLIEVVKTKLQGNVQNQE